MLWGGSPVVPVPVLPPPGASVLAVVGVDTACDVGVVPAVLIGGVAVARCNPLALTATEVGGPEVTVTGVTLVTVAAAVAALAVLVVVDDDSEPVDVVVNDEALVVVVV